MIISQCYISNETSEKKEIHCYNLREWKCFHWESWLFSWTCTDNPVIVKRCNEWGKRENYSKPRKYWRLNPFLTSLEGERGKGRRLLVLGFKGIFWHPKPEKSCTPTTERERICVVAAKYSGSGLKSAWIPAQLLPLLVTKHVLVSSLLLPVSVSV